MKNEREFFIPSDYSNNVIHFNLNLILFALVRHTASGDSKDYATVNEAL